VLGAAGAFAKGAPTRARKPGSSSRNPAGAPDAFYALGAVYLAWRARDAPGAEYLRAARDAGLALGFVSVTERAALVAWLEGAAPAHEDVLAPEGACAFRSGREAMLTPCADESYTPPGSPPAHVKALAAARGAGAAGGAPSRKRYAHDPADSALVKKIRAGELTFRDRQSVLRGTKPNVGATAGT
jgi:parafibromin